MKNEPKPETLEQKLLDLAEMRAEYNANLKAFREKNKHLRDNIKCLENIIKQEVMERKETVIAGNIKAEYVPQVVIKVKKEKENGE